MDPQTLPTAPRDHAAEVLDLYTTHKGRMADWEADRDRWHHKVFDLVEAGWSIKRVAELHQLSTTRIHAIIARVAEIRQKAEAEAAAAHPLLTAAEPAGAEAA
jgi:hypothetical protein